MGVSLEPVGPLPASTYWRRRAVLVAALLVLLLLLAKACGGGGGGGGDEQSLGGDPSATPTPTPSAAPSPSVTGSATPSAPVSASPSAPVSASPSASPTPTPTGPVGACAIATGLRFAATADRKSYPLGTTAKLSLTMVNTGTTACTVGIGQGDLEFRVTSGSDRIWSSDDCSPGGAKRTTSLKPGDRITSSLSWSLARSAPGCSARPAVKPGTYVVAARTGSVASDGFSFTVTPAA